MKDETLKFLQAIYFDATTTIRHYDSTRTSFGQMFAAILSFITALAVAGTTTGAAPRLLVPLAGLAMLLSIVAVAIMARFGKLIEFQRKRASAAMEAFERGAGENGLTAVQAEAQRRAGPRPRIRLRHLWVLVFTLVAAANVAVLATVLS